MEKILFSFLVAVFFALPVSLGSKKSTSENISAGTNSSGIPTLRECHKAQIV